MITLESKEYEITKVKNKTAAKVLCSVNVGDRIKFSLPMEPQGVGSRGHYAVYTTFHNLTTNETVQISMSQFKYKFEYCFDFQEC